MKKLLVGILALLFSFAVFAGTTDLDRLLLHERYGEDPWLGFGTMAGTSGIFTLEFDDADGDAACLVLDLPAGGDVNVPVFLMTSTSSADYDYFADVTVPTFAIEDDDGDSYVALDWTDDDDARLATGGGDARLDIHSPILGFGRDLGAQLVLIVTDTTGAATITQTGSGTTMSWTVPAFTFTNPTSMSTFTPSWVLGYDVGAAMTIAVADDTGNVTITQTGSSVSVAWTASGGFLFTGDFEVVGSTTLDDLTLSSSLTLANGEILANAPDGTVTLTGDDDDGLDFQIIAYDGTTTSDAVLTLVADGGGETADTWSLESEANGNDFTINNAAEVLNLNTSGDLQIDGDFEVTGDGITFGTNLATIENTDTNTLTITETTIAIVGIADITGNLTQDGALVSLDGQTSVDVISAGHVDLESSLIHLGFDATDYMLLTTTQTSGNLAITHPGNTPDVTWTAGSFDFTGDFTADGAAMIFDGSTTVDLISAARIDLEAPIVRLGFDSNYYMTFTTAQTSSNLAITHTGTPAVTWAATSFGFTGAFAVDSATTLVLDGATSVRGISAGFTSLEANDIRFGFDASSYMKIVPVQTTGSVAITHVGSGATDVSWTADSFDFIGTMALDTTTFGANAAGVDVTFYGAITQYKTWWDANGDGNGAWFFGADDYGVDVTFYGQTQTESVTWDASADTWYFGASDDEGVDVTAYGETAGVALDWDASDGALELDGAANITHEDAVGAGVLFLTIATGPTYAQTASATVLKHGGVDIEIPANADIEKIEIVVTTAYNGGGNDQMDVGVSGGDEDAYADAVDVSSAGYLDNNILANIGDVGGAAIKLCAQYADANDDASAGASLIYIYWRNY